MRYRRIAVIRLLVLMVVAVAPPTHARAEDKPTLYVLVDKEDCRSALFVLWSNAQFRRVALWNADGKWPQADKQEFITALINATKTPPVNEHEVTNILPKVANGSGDDWAQKLVRADPDMTSAPDAPFQVQRKIWSELLKEAPPQLTVGQKYGSLVLVFLAVVSAMGGAYVFWRQREEIQGVDMQSAETHPGDAQHPTVSRPDSQPRLTTPVIKQAPVPAPPETVTPPESLIRARVRKILRLPRHDLRRR